MSRLLATRTFAPLASPLKVKKEALTTQTQPKIIFQQVRQLSWEENPKMSDEEYNGAGEELLSTEKRESLYNI